MSSKKEWPGYIHPSEMALFRRVTEIRSVAQVAKEFELPEDVVEGAVSIVLRFLGAESIDDAIAQIEGAIAEPDPLDREIDFSNGRRGVHYNSARKGSNVVKIDADIWKLLPNPESVNAALRAYLESRKGGLPKSA